jgi:hypothetical protein
VVRFFMNYGTAFGVYELSYIVYDGKNLQLGFMKKLSNRLILFVALSIASIIGVLKGTEAKQKWVFRIKSRFDEKRHLAELKKIQRDGGVLLDDIEIAAFHN